MKNTVAVLLFTVLAIALAEGFQHAENDDNFVANFKLPRKQKIQFLNLISINANSDYYFTISIHRQDWETSLSTCHANGAGWELLSIGTTEKANAVNDFLAYEGVKNEEFWTSGKYSGSSATKFVWADGSPLPDWAPWKKLPPPTSNDRVSYIMGDVDSSKWSRLKNTGVSRQSICEYNFPQELPPTTEPPTNPK